MSHMQLKLTVALKPRVRGLGKRRVRKALEHADSVLTVGHEGLRGALDEILNALRTPKDTLKALNGGGSVAFDGLGYDVRARVVEVFWHFSDSAHGTAAAARVFGHIAGAMRRLDASGLPTALHVKQC